MVRRLIAETFREYENSGAERNDAFKALASVKGEQTEAQWLAWLQTQDCYPKVTLCDHVWEYLSRLHYPNVRLFYQGMDEVWLLPPAELDRLDRQLQQTPQKFLFRAQFEAEFPKHVRELALDARLDSIWQKMPRDEQHHCTPHELVTTYRQIHMRCEASLSLFTDLRLFTARVIRALIKCKALVVSPFVDTRIYPQPFWQAQDTAAECVAQLLKEPQFYPSDAYGGKGRVLSRDYLDPGQLDALALAESVSLCVITGGPGTGKSELPPHLQRKGHRLLLLASTGAAAMILSQRCQLPAYTIHYALQNFSEDEWNSYTDVFVDESTMIPFLDVAVPLLQRLVKMQKRRHTCFCGDVKQLNGMQSGAFFRSLIKSWKVPVAELTKIHRLLTDAADVIRRNAERVLAGDMDFELNEAFEHKGSLTDADICRIFEQHRGNVTFTSYHRRTVERINGLLVKHMSQKLGQLRTGQRVVFKKNFYRVVPGVYQKGPRKKPPKKLENEDDDIEYLDEEKKGEEEEKKKQPQHLMPEIERYVSNGMTGIIKKMEDVHRENPKQRAKVIHSNVPPLPGFARYLTIDTGHLIIPIDITRVPPHTICNGDARTVHHFQGGQNKVVVIFISDWGFDTELLFTAMTRAQEKVILVGSTEALQRVMRRPIKRRDSELAISIRSKCPK